MDMILTKITHSIDSNKRDSYIYAVTLMGLFTFLFLGVEYFFYKFCNGGTPPSKF